MSQPLLSVRNLAVAFRGTGFPRKNVPVLRGIDLDVARGETLGLVGESGSGKTTLGRAILGLVPVHSGRIDFDGADITGLRRRERRRLASDIQVVFQDPYSSLSPALTVGDILAEPLRAQGVSRKEAEDRIDALLELVHLPNDARQRLPREFSGGQRQRIAIARALALSPRLIICDEPVSALDLTNQRRILDLFLEVQERTGVSYLFISHDLDVVRVMCHRIAVMYRGEIVELGDGAQVATDPVHPYTRRLLLASPVPDPKAQAIRRAELASVEKWHHDNAGAGVRG